MPVRWKAEKFYFFRKEKEEEDQGEGRISEKRKEIYKQAGTEDCLCVHYFERILEFLKEAKWDGILQAHVDAKGDKMRPSHLPSISHSILYNKLWDCKIS